jgi:sugar lactone lactonase YvrE
MHSRLTATFAFSAAAAVISLAGCSGSSTPAGSQLPSSLQSIAHAARPPLGSRAAVQTLLIAPGAHPTAHFPPTVNPLAGSEYVLFCGAVLFDCGVVNTSGTEVGSVTTSLDEPQGTTVDAEGNWLIANTEDNNVPIYTITDSGGPVLSTTISDPKEYPADVAVFDKGKKTVKATTAISNIIADPNGNGSILVIKPTGKTKVLTDFLAARGIGITFDAAGDCYWSYETSGGASNIVEFKKCAGSAITAVNNIGYAGGLAFDGSGNLWYASQLKGIYHCTSGTTGCSLAFSGFADALFIAFDSTFTNLYVADPENNVIDQCPVAGNSCTTFYTGTSGDEIVGVAVTPEAIP